MLNMSEKEAAEKQVCSAESEELIKQAVQKVRDADNQLEALKPHLDNIIVGEDNNKQVALTLLVGSKCKEVKMKQIIVFKGTAGGGKTTLANALTKGFNTKRIGRFSENALDYTVLAPYEILYIKELGDMDANKQGISRLKFLSSEDEGYTVEYTVRAEGGGFTTKRRKIPPKTVVSTTTRLTLERQFDRRAWAFNVDESEEQTKRIALWKAKRKKQDTEVKLGRRKITDYVLSTEVVKRFLQQFETAKVLILFPETLSRVLGYNQLRIRGDIDKIYTFVELHAMFNKKRLLPIKDSDCLIITPEVCAGALKLLAEPLTNMLSGIDKRTRALLEVLKEFGLDRASLGYVITKEERDRIARKLGKNHNTIKAWLHNLCNAGMAAHNSRKPLTFALLHDVDEIEESLSNISLKSKSFDDLVTEMRKEGQLFARSLSLKRG